LTKKNRSLTDDDDDLSCCSIAVAALRRILDSLFATTSGR